MVIAPFGQVTGLSGFCTAAGPRLRQLSARKKSALGGLGARDAGPRALAYGRTRRKRATFFKSFAEIAFPYFAALCDGASIMVAAMASSQIYRFATLGQLPDVEAVPGIGLVVALFVVVATAQRSGYALQRYAEFAGHVGRSFPIWNVAFFCALALGFSTRTSELYSRGATAALYGVGFVALLGARAALVLAVQSTQRNGLLPARRLFVVGFEDELRACLRRPDFASRKLEVAGALALREPAGNLREDLALAAAAIRISQPDDILIAIPWRRADVIESCFDVLLRTPANIHIASDEILDRFSEARIGEIGSIASLSLTSAPLSALQRFEKRAFDVIAAGVALALLSPVIAGVALLLRLQGGGPVLFRQRRYGFNQEPFAIAKFRTLNALEDGARVRAVSRDDPRVTRLGAFLRRASLDELPQLVNVLRGEMSLVGPRPHALAHDQRYEMRIANYARRHNMKPGITGWAQVNGHRGEILSDEAMRARVEHDLYYIDHWSLWLDVKIIFKTVVSPKARSNAY